jgi:hypothetical protein
MKIRWWLLQRLAKSMGLRVGLQAWMRPDYGINDSWNKPVLVVFSSEDRYTLQAMHLLGKFGRGPDVDHRHHVEWTH